MSTKTGQLFERLKPVLDKHGADMVSKCGAVYCFEIKTSKDAAAVHYTVDLKNGNGKDMTYNEVV